MIHVFLAAAFPRREEMRHRSAELETLGMVVTSSWVHATDSEEVLSRDAAKAIAATNVSDVADADVLVLWTGMASTTGGYHVELGIALGLSLTDARTIIIVGARPNIYATLADHHVGTWREAVAILTRMARDDGEGRR